MLSLSQGFWGLNPAKADIFRVRIGRRARLPLRWRPSSPRRARLPLRRKPSSPELARPPLRRRPSSPQVSRALLCRRAPTLGSTELHLTGRPPPPADWILPPSEDPTPRSVRLLSSPADWAKRPGKRGSKHVPEEERIEQHKLRAGDAKGDQHQRKQEQNDAGDNYEDAVSKAPKQKRNRDNNQEAA